MSVLNAAAEGCLREERDGRVFRVECRRPLDTAQECPLWAQLAGSGMMAGLLAVRACRPSPDDGGGGFHPQETTLTFVSLHHPATMAGGERRRS